MHILNKLHAGLYYIVAKILAIFVVYLLAEKLGGFAEYAKETIKLLIAIQIIVSGSQLLLQQAANEINRLFLINVIAANTLASILYIKLAGLADSLIWGMVFSTCTPILIAYNSGRNARHGEILNILSILISQPLFYCSYKIFSVNLAAFQLDYLIVFLFISVFLFIIEMRKIPLEIKKNYAWRTTEVVLTQGVLLYFAEKLLHKSSSDEIITYWIFMQLASGIIFLANSFSYSIINSSVKVDVGKNNMLVMIYKAGALSMGVLLFLAVKTSYGELYYGFFLIIQGVMKFPGYALLGKNKSHVLFKSNVSSFAFMLVLDNLIEFNSFESYIQIQIAAALTATLLTYLQLRRESPRLIKN